MINKRNNKNRCTSLTNNNKRCKNKIYEKNLCYNHFKQFICKFNFNIKNEDEYEDKMHFFIKYLIMITIIGMSGLIACFIGQSLPSKLSNIFSVVSKL